MPRSPRCLPQGYSFHITLRCNSRQFLIAKGLRRDVLLAVLAKAQAKVPHRLYEVGAFYWTVLAPDIVNPGREERFSIQL
jgi:REP element-mobilizing transposase RayT